MRKKIYFENSKGDRLCGILSKASSKNTRLNDNTQSNDSIRLKNPVIIFFHGFSSSKESSIYIKLEEMLNKNKIDTFRFDFYGHGESEGKFEDITISEAVDDILNAIKLLKKKGYKKIGLVGSSFGGMAILVAASKTKGLYVLALKAPVSDYLGKIISQITRYPVKEWKEKGYIYYQRLDGRKLKLNYSFFEDANKVSGYSCAKKIKIPTIIIHGDKDLSVPLEQSNKTASLIKNCRLKIIKGGDHIFSNPNDFELSLRLIYEFIIKNIK